MADGWRNGRIINQSMTEFMNWIKQMQPDVLAQGRLHWFSLNSGLINRPFLDYANGICPSFIQFLLIAAQIPFWNQQLNLFYCGGFQLQLLIPHSQSQFELCLLISETAVWVSEIKKAWNERKPEWIMMAWMNAIQAGKNDCCWSEYEMNEREKKKAEWKDWLNWKFSSIPERMNN